MPVETAIRPPSTQPMPLNRVADELESAMAGKLAELLKPFQDGAKATVTTEGTAITPPTAQPVAPAATPVAAPVVAPVEPPIPDIDQPPADASKATKENWNRYRALKNAEIEKRDKELAEIRKAAADAQAEIERIKSLKSIDPLEYDQVRKTKEELEATVERLRLEESPKFKSYYDGGIEKQLRLVKTIAGPHGDEVVKLIQSPRSKERNDRLREIQEELGPEGYVINNALGEITRLQHERSEQLANWKENSRRLRETEQAEAEAAKTRSLESRKAMAEKLLARARELPEFKPADGDKDHSAFASSALDFIRNAAEGRLAEEDSLLLPVAAMKAQYLDTVKVPKLEAELTALRARVAELTGARPQVNGQQQRSGQPATSQRDANDPYGVNAITKRFNELMGRS